MSEVILDLETYSTRSDAVILSIGAIRFVRGAFVPSLDDMDVFYRRIDVRSCNDIGLHTDPATVEWWSKQDRGVRDECINNPDRVSIRQALEEFCAWFGSSTCVWGNGSSFDVTIIETAMGRCDIKPPWKFWNIRDVRTLYDIGRVSSKDLPQTNLHNPVDDCYRELQGMSLAFKNLFPRK